MPSLNSVSKIMGNVSPSSCKFDGIRAVNLAHISGALRPNHIGDVQRDGILQAPGVTFAYRGRRGALTQFALEAGRAALAHKLISATISVSRQNERFDAFLPFGDAIFSIDTFESNAGALLGAWRIRVFVNASPRACRQTAREP